MSTTTGSEHGLRARAEQFGQGHLFRFWDQLDEAQRTHLLSQVSEIDFPCMQRLIETWVLDEPDAEHFTQLSPVSAIPEATPDRPDARAAWAAGEEALRAGRVALFLVAGGQGTRLGFPGPKGAYPVGPITGKTLFQYHAEKILNLQRRYNCTLPWFIMVSDTNQEETREFFEQHDYFGLGEGNVQFLTQDMVPCVDEQGKFILEEPDSLAMNPNGHGGCIPAMVKHGVLQKCRDRGIDILSYFQVDNWAARVVDPYFLGYHVLRNAEASSKINRKYDPREAVGVHCICDGEYRVIEYSELDIYPQLLETDEQGNVVFYAGNPAIHQFSVHFIQRVNDHFDEFPWHRAHKKIPFVNEAGETVTPDKPNGYKFETFVFDSLRYAKHEPVALEITPEGQYTPIKQFEGANSVVQARQSMARMWAKWLEAAGAKVPRDEKGDPTIQIEISPAFALYQEEFVEKTQGRKWPENLGHIAIGTDGELESK